MKIKLIIMNFLQFAIWGAYLTSMDNYLGRVERGNEIAWFYAIQGIVSVFRSVPSPFRYFNGISLFDRIFL